MEYHETLAKLAEWNEVKAKLDVLKLQEESLRKEIFNSAFPNAKEGVNTFDIENGWKLKGENKINRRIDESLLKVVKDELKEKFNFCIEMAVIIKYKPDLVITNYRNLSEELKHVFDKALVIKPGMPSLEIIAPKEKK